MSDPWFIPCLLLTVAWGCVGAWALWKDGADDPWNGWQR